MQRPAQIISKIKITPVKSILNKWIFLCLLIIGIMSVQAPGFSYAEEGTASWYSKASCMREGTWQKFNGKMANGKEFKDGNFTCAIWKYPFGSLLRVTNLRNGRVVYVQVTDRGPSKRLVKKGRIIDLSKGAFSQIASLKSGVIRVQIERIK